MINKKPNPVARKPGNTISLEELLPHAGGSMFRLARVAMLRAKEIHFGSHPLVDCDPLDKETTIALREISEGKSPQVEGDHNKDEDDQKGD